MQGCQPSRVSILFRSRCRITRVKLVWSLVQSLLGLAWDRRECHVLFTCRLACARCDDVALLTWSWSWSLSDRPFGDQTTLGRQRLGRSENPARKGQCQNVRRTAVTPQAQAPCPISVVGTGNRNKLLAVAGLRSSLSTGAAATPAHVSLPIENLMIAGFRRGVAPCSSILSRMRKPSTGAATIVHPLIRGIHLFTRQNQV